uniref:Prefoldin subunit 3 n=1 Tax=Panagrellus redivivus TaxID=6233 RepID=A0A7E4UWV9_PANRE
MSAEIAQLDEETLKSLRLGPHSTSSDDAPALDVLGRMEKKGVPTAEVITDVESWLKENKVEVDEAHRRVQENFRKYKLVESSLQSQREKVGENEPEFEQGRALLDKLVEAVKNPDTEWPLTIQYPIADQVYAHATIDKTETLFVLLGCNTMVELTIDETEKMFEKNLTGIQTLTTQLSEEIDFIKDQITTSEVNLAHLFNYKVALKKAQAAEQK